MRDRLIRLLKMVEYQYTQINSIMTENVADWLLQRGVIVPPCKVGDTVYRIYCGNYLVEEKVCSFNMIGSGLFYTNEDCRETPCIKFGKTVFLTREEAERALEGGGEG